MWFVKGLAWGVLAFVIDAYAVWLLWGWHGVAVGLPATLKHIQERGEK